MELEMRSVVFDSPCAEVAAKAGKAHDGGLPARSNRNSLIDAARGLSLVFMAIDHVAQHPLARFSDTRFGVFGFFTASTSFVFLSGLVSGLVYGKTIEAKGKQYAYLKALRRAWQLYVWHVFLLSAILASALLNPGNTALRAAFPLFYTNPLKALCLILLLLYQPGYFDILPMYCVFLVFTPWLITLIRERRVWPVLLVSASIWFLIQARWLHMPNNPNGILLNGLNPLAFQLVFVVGLVFGSLPLWNIGRQHSRRLLVLVSGAISLLLLVLRFAVAFRPQFCRAITHSDLLLGAETQGSLRLLNFAAFAVVVWAAFVNSAAKLQRFPAFGILVRMGQKSLPAFLCSAVYTQTANVLLSASSDLSLRLAVTVVSVLVLLIPSIISDVLSPLWAKRKVSKYA